MDRDPLAPSSAAPQVKRLVMALLVVVAFALLAQFTYLIPDSAGYLSWGRSLLWDGDVDFTNEYASYGMIEADSGIHFGATTTTGRPGNPFGMGTALLWMPFLLLSLCVSHVFHWLGQAVGVDGFTTGTLFAAHLGTWTCAVCSVILVDAAVRQWDPQGSANRLAVAAAFLAMPLPYYVWQLASYSHAASVCMVAAVVYLTLRWQQGARARHALLLGLVVGIAGMVRLQNLLFAWLPLCLLYSEWRRRRFVVGGTSMLLLGCFLAFLPQLVAWRCIYGVWLQIPQGDGFLSLSPASLVHVLISTRHGLLTTAPLIVVAGGLLVLRVGRRSRRMGVAIAGCFLLQWFANAVPVDWWAGWSFGARRFCNLIPLLALILACWQGRRARIVQAVFITANLVQWLRVATRQLSGEGDPGWNGLWGSDFLAFLPNIPEALLAILRTPWDRIAVLAQPGAGSLQVRSDPFLMLLTLFLVWSALIGALVIVVGRRLAPQLPRPGNSRGPQSV